MKFSLEMLSVKVWLAASYLLLAAAAVALVNDDGKGGSNINKVKRSEGESQT